MVTVMARQYDISLSLYHSLIFRDDRSDDGFASSLCVQINIDA